MTEAFIGKVMSSGHAADELEAIHVFKEMDPTGAFGVYAGDALPVDATRAFFSAGGERELDSCADILAVRILRDQGRAHARGRRVPAPLSRDEAPVEIIMPRAACSFDDGMAETARGHWWRDPAHAAMLWRALRNLYAGIVHYHAHDMVHLDIKPANVVMIGSATAPTSMKFIDFGLSATRRAVEENPYATALASAYEHYPALTQLVFAVNPSRKLAFLWDDTAPDFPSAPAAQHAQEAWQEARDPPSLHTPIPPSLVLPQGAAATRVKVVREVWHVPRSSSLKWAMARATDVYGLGMIAAWVLYAVSGYSVNCADPARVWVDRTLFERTEDRVDMTTVPPHHARALELVAYSACLALPSDATLLAHIDDIVELYDAVAAAAAAAAAASTLTMAAAPPLRRFMPPLHRFVPPPAHRPLETTMVAEMPHIPVVNDGQNLSRSARGIALTKPSLSL